MVISEIQSLYRDEDDLAVIKRMVKLFSEKDVS